MTDLVERVGTALYGTGWREPLAAALGLSESAQFGTVRAFRVWASGRSPIPVGVLEELLELLEERDTQIAALRAELSVAIKERERAA